MQDRFKFRAWYTSISREEEPHYVYDIEQLYDGYVNSGRHELAWVSDFGSLLDSPEEYIIEQCTGLKDKNGKLIYEGDILKLTDQMIDYIVEVYWSKGMFCYDITPNNANLVFCDLTDNETIVEVIGNIHENSNLLEKENEREIKI